jgi:YggT family protein
MILQALTWLIIIDSILSFVMPADRFPRSLTTQLTDPLYAPVRMLLRPERTGGFDLSPLVILVLIQILESMLQRAAANSF